MIGIVTTRHLLIVIRYSIAIRVVYGLGTEIGASETISKPITNDFRPILSRIGNILNGQVFPAIITDLIADLAVSNAHQNRIG